MHTMDAGDELGSPSMKRYKLHQHPDPSNPPHHHNSPECLPAKKRMEIHHPLLLTTICLPAKKRVWAPPPSSPLKPQTPLDEDDGVICGVCGSTDGHPQDPIVFCDGCDLAVHASCYGDPLVRSIPEGDWFCLRCSNAESDCSVMDCCLCPVKGGAVKPTTDGNWAHILCAVLVPEVYFRNPVARDGIDCSRVPEWRRKGKCYICRMRCGCVIECSERKCGLHFHVSCGLEEELCIEYREGKGGADGDIVAGFCRDHTLLWKKYQGSGKYKIVAREDGHNGKRKANN